MILCTAPRRGKKPFPSVAVGVMASLIGHRWSKDNPLKALLPMATSSKGKRPNGAASTQPRATPWVSGLPVICALKGQKLYVVGAFALTGRVYLGARIPRALPWAMSTLAFQAAEVTKVTKTLLPMATSSKGKRPNGAAITQPRATPWVSGLPVICALKGQKLYVVGAFALTGRVYLGARIPRALPWAMSSLAFQAALPCLSIAVTPTATEGHGSLAFQATEAAEAIETTKATEGIEPNEATHPSCVMASKTFPTCSLTITYIT